PGRSRTANAGRPGFARRRRPGTVGGRSSIRRPLRARDADGGTPRAGSRLSRGPPRPTLLGRAPRPAPGLRRTTDPAVPRRPPRRTRPATGTRDRRGGRARPPPPVPEAGGPGPHGRPQDQQRTGPDAAREAPRQDAGHRRDRSRPARRGNG